MRAEAVQALGMIGDESALEAIKEMLKDPESMVREYALTALRLLGTREAIKALKSHKDLSRCVREEQSLISWRRRGRAGRQLGGIASA